MSQAARDLPAPLRYRALAFAARGIVRVLYRPRVTGREHVPHGGFILCSNHLSGFDLVALAYPLSRRWLRHMAKPQLFEHRLLGTLVRLLGAFPAESGAAERAAELAGEGYPVVIMPEGARRRPGDVYRPHTGAARAALAAGVPLVPAAVRGTDRARRFSRWSVAFASPIRLEDLAGQEPRAAAALATERLWSTIQALEASLAEPDQGVPPAAANSRSSAR
jgi:1-acyl-sn-glycerol-3-phosphate acyltransferase